MATLSFPFTLPESLSVYLDVDAPSAPGAPAIGTIGASTVALTWAASTDATGVTRYDIYNGTTLLGNSTTAAYSATVVEGVTYSFTVKAVDAAGNISAASPSTAYTHDTSVPTTPGTPVASNLTPSSVTLTWTASTDASGIAGYDIYDGSTLVGSSATTTYDATLTGGTYNFNVKARDTKGNTSAASGNLTLVVTAPGIPTGLTAIQASSTSRTVNLSWTASTGTPTQYRVYRGGTLLTTVTATNYVDSSVPADGSYDYTVSAGNAAGNWSAQTSATSVNVVTIAAVPAAPTLTPDATGATRKVTVSWVAVAGATSYEVARNGVSVGTTASTSLDDTPGADGAYGYTVRSVNSSGNSAYSTATNISIDRTPPGAPYQLTAAQSVVTSRTVSVAWSGSVDSVEYRVYRGGVLLGSTTNKTWSDTSLIADGTYSYTVSARDTDNNWTAQSDPVSVTVTLIVITSAPSAPTVVLDAAPSRRVTISWTAVSGATAYDLYRDGVLFTDNVTSPHVITSHVDGTFQYSLVAKNAAGSSARSSATSLTVDRTAPDAVTNVVATQPSNLNRNISLTWTGASDSVSYSVYRGGVLLGTSATASYSDTSITTDGTYSYTVTAKDAEGNVSTASASASVTVGQLAVPVKPGAPTLAIAASPSRDITVTFSSVAGATEYDVARDGTIVATGAVLSYVVTGTTDGTHQFTVRARNAAGNGVYSDSASITVDRTPPAVPINVTAKQTSKVSRRVTVSWQNDSDVNIYALKRGIFLVQATPTLNADTGIYSVVDNNIDADGVYSYTLTGQDAAGNVSAASVPATVTVSLLLTPAVPVPTATLAKYPSRTVTITWPVVDSATGYSVYMGSTLVNGNVTGTTIDITNVADGTYTFGVKAYNEAGTSASGTATLAVDRTPPPAPTNFFILSHVGRVVTGTWDASSGAYGYEIIRNGLEGTTVNTTTFTETVPKDGLYVYMVRAVDRSGNPSGYSNEGVVLINTATPDAPQIRVKATGFDVSVSWNAQNNVTSYILYRDEVEVYRGSALEFSETLPAGRYTYDMQADDSDYSEPVTILVSDRAVIPAPELSYRISGRTITLFWTSVSGALSYLVSRNGTSIGITENSIYLDKNLSPGTYTYVIRTITENVSGLRRGSERIFGAGSPDDVESNQITVVLEDTEAPTIPVVRADVDVDDITVSWNVDEDVERYQMSRNGEILGVDLADEYLDADLADGTYSYSLRAMDESENWSPFSTPVYATVAGEEALTAPERVTLSIQDHTVTISWDSSPDAVSYILYRNGSAVHSGTELTYKETLNNGTYTYTLKFADAANNQSPASQGRSITLTSGVADPNKKYNLGRLPLPELSLGHAPVDEDRAFLDREW